MTLPRTFLLACKIIGSTTQSIQEAKAASGYLPGFMLTSAFEKVPLLLLAQLQRIRTASGAGGVSMIASGYSHPYTPPPPGLT